jgi:hypothetical protein
MNTENYFYYPDGLFTKKENNNDLEYISLKTILGLANNKKVILVNTLSHKSNILLFCKNMNMRSTTGDEFKNIIKKDKKSFDIAILYCANYSCNASKKYHKKLNLENNMEEKIYHYQGGIYEWALCSCLMPINFKIFSIKQKKEANIGEIKNLIKDFSHFTNNDQNNKNKIISNASIEGNKIYSEIFK